MHPIIDTISAKEAAEILEDTTSNICWLCRNKQLKSFKLGGQWRIYRKYVEELKESLSPENLAKEVAKLDIFTTKQRG